MVDGIAALRERRPDASGALDDALAQAHAVDPDGVLDLCRARIRMLLGGHVDADDPKLLAVGDYATSDLFSDTERLAIEFGEQYVLDVANTPDELVAALRERLGDRQLYAFVMGLYAVDQAERLRLTGAVHPGATP